MKKKLFSLLAVALFSSSLMSVSSNVEAEEDGRASDCVRMARATTLAYAAYEGVDPNDPAYLNSFLSHYMDLYTDCLNN